MPGQNYNYASVIVPILNFLRAHPGMSFTSEELCQQLDCTPQQVRLALAVLVHARVARKEASGSESARYIWGDT